MIDAIYLGITQGLTEFLPVSSSGHLYLIQKLLQRLGSYRQEDFIPFFVFLHAATILAVILYLRRDVLLIFEKKLFLNIAAITFASGMIALLIKYFLSAFFSSSPFLSLCFLINSAILLSIKKINGTKTFRDLSLRDSLFIGILQGVSFLPGISRSGITITGMLKRGYSREQAFLISFLCAIPVITAAFLIECKELAKCSFSILEISAGFISAFIFGLIALILLKKSLVSDKFRNFAYYCLAVSIAALLL